MRRAAHGRLAGYVIAVLLVVGCSSNSNEQARPLTEEESQRVAVMRYRNFSHEVRQVNFAIVDSGVNYEVAGWVDYPAAVGYATIQADGDNALIAWTASGLATFDLTHEDPPADPASMPPIPPPDASGWMSSDLDPTSSRLHTSLALLLELGNDRPDNPLLLQQTDARWLRTDVIGGVEVDVVSGPSSDHAQSPGATVPPPTVKYWLDQAGTLLRVEARLGAGDTWTSMDMTNDVNIDVDLSQLFLHSGPT